MLRITILSTAVAILVGVSTANAESPYSAPMKSPGEIAAASRHLAEKQESCRVQAKAQKLRFFKRRSFIRKCMKNKA
ncbi:MAG: hypothetical protein ACLQDM_17785 [Bradyrhizobium sp.]